MKRVGQRLREVDLGYGTQDFILNGRVILISCASFLYFYCAKTSVLLSVFNGELKIIIALCSLHRFDLLGHRSLIVVIVMLFY
jgi:hypothetical protein